MLRGRDAPSVRRLQSHLCRSAAARQTRFNIAAYVWAVNVARHLLTPTPAIAAITIDIAGLRQLSGHPLFSTSPGDGRGDTVVQTCAVRGPQCPLHLLARGSSSSMG